MRRYNSTRSTIIMTILILVMFSICMDVQRAEGAEKREFGVAAGHHFVIALKKDGTVWGWGSNSTGQMATGKVTEKSTLKPTKIAGLKDINKVVAGDFHAFAMANGKVWGWGLNRDGQLGLDSTDEYITRPTLVKTLKNVVTISGGGSHNLALTKQGTVLAWGNNSAGQLGTGNNKPSRKPVAVPGLTNIVHINASSDTSYAIRADGTLWAWGDNSAYQLADGTDINRNKPVKVKGISALKQVAGGWSSYTLALKKDGTVWTWGRNDEGQLGNGSVSVYVAEDGFFFRDDIQTVDHDEKRPIQVKGIRDVAKLTASFGNALALTKSGEVWIWGDNAIGQIGDGTQTIHDEHGFYMLENHERTSPYQFPGLKDIVDVQASPMRNYYVIDKSGNLWAWGNNMFGMIGDGKETTYNPRNPTITYVDNNRTTAIKIMKL